MHLIKSYCKRHFNEKIPPKQNRSQIQNIEMIENPDNDVLLRNGIKFPTHASAILSPSCTFRFFNPSDDAWSCFQF